MKRCIGLMYLLCVTSAGLHGQTTIYKDGNGQVLTQVDVYNSDVKNASGLTGAAHNQVVYQGSPFLTFPVWQPATVRLDGYGQDVVCELAYNLVTNEVTCRTAGDPVGKLVTPIAFNVDGKTYVRLQNKSIGPKYFSYCTALHTGPTKLLASFSKQAKAGYTANNGYDKELNVKGSYQISTKYYVQKGDAFPEIISLSKNSLLKVLYEQAKPIAAKLPDKQLTTEQVIATLMYYDSLTAAANANKLPLSNDPVFNQTLHDKISYPNLAWNQGVYGRVYVGFEVSEQGNVKNITLLSPQNAGFGFAEAVLHALAKLPAMNPTLQGRYALPVAFTYTNTKEQTESHVPVNQLPADRLGERVLLNEFTVPFVVDKPIANTREVWGYYK